MPLCKYLLTFFFFIFAKTEPQQIKHWWIMTVIYLKRRLNRRLFILLLHSIRKCHWICTHAHIQAVSYNKTAVNQHSQAVPSSKHSDHLYKYLWSGLAPFVPKFMFFQKWLIFKKCHFRLNRNFNWKIKKKAFFSFQNFKCFVIFCFVLLFSMCVHIHR